MYSWIFQPPIFHTFGLGLVPKHNGGWPIIYHLSTLHDLSMNNFIDPAQYSLSYCTINDAYTIGPKALTCEQD